MSVGLHALLALASTAIVSGLAAAVFFVAMQPALGRPLLGNRGLKRARAMRRGGAFAVVEPMLRYGGAWFSRLPLDSLRRRIARDIVRSGDYLGLCADELLALSFLLGLLCGLIATVFGPILGLSNALAPLATSLGFASPWLRVRSLARARSRRVTRALPASIDLVSMCMSAGLDFPSALRRTEESAPDPNEPIAEELRRVLQELDLGRTRRAAILGFAERIPSDEVRELANSLIQAEDKGSPVAQVLSVQAETLRLRRSVAAEETASEAALMLIGPMTLIFLCVIVLLLGPVVARVTGGGGLAS